MDNPAGQLGTGVLGGERWALEESAQPLLVVVVGESSTRPRLTVDSTARWR